MNTCFPGRVGDFALCWQRGSRRAPELCDGLMRDGQRKRPLGGLDGSVVMETAIRLGRAAPAPCVERLALFDLRLESRDF